MAASNAPQVGQIIPSLADERTAGRVGGRKVRPCLIVAVEYLAKDQQPRVTVLPITSQAPRGGANAIAIPNDIKNRIGLDQRRPAWIVVGEANAFTWPGFDLVPQRDGNSCAALSRADSFPACVMQCCC
jgi:hypothetical protein